MHRGLRQGPGPRGWGGGDRGDRCSPKFNTVVNVRPEVNEKKAYMKIKPKMKKAF